VSGPDDWPVAFTWLLRKAVGTPGSPRIIETPETRTPALFGSSVPYLLTRGLRCRQLRPPVDASGGKSGAPGVLMCANGYGARGWEP